MPQMKVNVGRNLLRKHWARPLAFWLFNEGGGLYINDSAGKYPLTRGGTGPGATWMAGPEGSVARSNRGSTNGYFQNANFANLTAITVMVRARLLATATSAAAFFSKSAFPWNTATTGWAFGQAVSSGGDPTFRVNSTNCTWAGVNIVDATWYTFAATFDNATIRLYVNGVQRATAALAATITTNTDPLITGHYDTTGGFQNDHSWAGVWDWPMTAQQVVSMTNEPMQIFAAGRKRRRVISSAPATSILRQMMAHHGG